MPGEGGAARVSSGGVGRGGAGASLAVARSGRGAGAASGRARTVDRVLLHREEEARRHLRLRRPRVEHRRRGVGEPALRHELVRLDRRVEVALVDADRHAHQHLLRPLGDLAVHPQQVRLLEGLEAEVVVLEVALVLERAVEALLVRHDDLVHLVRDERRRLAGLRVFVRVEPVHHARERGVGVLLQVGRRDARREPRVVGVLRRQVRRRLGRQVVERRRGHAVVDALNHLLRHPRRVHELRVEGVAELRDARGDLVEGHRLLAAVTLHHLHFFRLALDDGRRVLKRDRREALV